MKSFQPANILHRDIYDSCAQQYGAVDDRSRLQKLRTTVLEAGSVFEVTLQQVDWTGFEPGNYSVEDAQLLRNLYSKRMVPLRGDARRYYDQIKISSNFCPYCGFGEVGALDHYFPKSVFPDLSVCPNNLVPICHSCNHIKLDGSPANGSGYYFHPYFDLIPKNIVWLKAEMEMVARGPVLRFFISADIEEMPIYYRMRYHFDKLQLDRRYQIRAVPILPEIELFIQYLGTGLNAEEVSEILHAEAELYSRSDANSIKTVSYRAAAMSLDFCSGRWNN